jgi:hypothetical protein
MAGAQKIFLLSCECGSQIEIVTGQAGGTTGCPACGRRVDVPKLRDFSGLRQKAFDDRPARTQWGVAHAVTLAGLALAVLAWASAAVVGAVPKAAFAAERIRADVHAEDDVVLYQALDDMINASVARMPMREEFELQRRAQFASGISRALMAVGGVGAALAAVAGVTLLVTRQRS